MRDSFIRLSKELGLVVRDGAEDEEIVAPIFAHFETKKCLFIFDNVQNAETLEKFIPKSITGDHIIPHILVTTLGGFLTASTDHEIYLDRLTIKDSVQLIQDQLRTSTEEDAKTLAEKMGCHPLALQQALAYIRETIGREDKNCIKRYLNKFENQAQQLLGDVRFKALYHDDYKLPTFATWHLTLKEIEKKEDVGQLAVKLINILAYLDPDQISAQFVQTVNAVSEDGDKILDCLFLLQKFSMVHRVDSSNGRQMVQIHGLVQHVIRLDLNSNGAEAGVVGHTMAAISKQFKKDEFTDETNGCKSHGLNLFQYQVQHFEATMKENWDYVSRVCFYLTQYGNYDASVKICEEASALYEEKNGAAHESTIQMKWKLAGTYSRRGKHSECLAILAPLYPLARDALGSDHWLTCTIIALQATTHVENGSGVQAIGIYDDIIAATTGRYGEADLDATTRVLYYKHCKADALLALKRFDEALELAQDVYDQRVKLFGTKDDARCFFVLKLVGSIWHKKGELTVAVDVWKQVQEGFEKLFGPDDARTIAAMKEIEKVNHEIEISSQCAVAVE